MHIHFVTGKLAERALRRVVETLAAQAKFDYSIDVLNITVAALMTPRWIAERINIPKDATSVMLPGYCSGDLEPLKAKTELPISLGPKDLRRLPEHFGQKQNNDNYGKYDIEIIAEVNHVARLSVNEVVEQAKSMRDDGADLIDLGCDPGEFCANIGDYVRALRNQGLRVSIDSLDPKQIEPAVKAGAELVLSVNRSNREYARDWGCEVVAIPDLPSDLSSLDETVEYLDQYRIPYRLDPILEPIGFGFANSLVRYHSTRNRYPTVRMMMGIGNLTELTDADSAGINVILMGICQELGVHSVLTTQVVNWARSSVRECDLARRLVAYAVREKSLPKHREPRLIPLRGEKPTEHGNETLDQLALQLKDNNYRVFAESGLIHLVWAGNHISDADPFELFNRLMATSPKNLDPGHAYYLGYEISKAATALTLNKQYEQDEALDWGYLTRAEKLHRLSGKLPSNELKQNSGTEPTSINDPSGENQ
jgi:dihydropteroate synthase